MHFWTDPWRRRRAFTLLLGALPIGLPACVHGASQAVKAPQADGRDAAPVAMPELRRELLDRKRKDQAVRTLDAANLSIEQRAALADQAEAVDAGNTARMKEIVDAFGWPTRSLVGEDGAAAAWLLVQHADQDVEFQERCLPLLERAADRGEIARSGVAYLTDRVLRARGRPQVYGTQYEAVRDANGNVIADADGKLQYLPPLVIDVEHLDDRRHAAGLGPWSEYEATMARIQERSTLFPAPRSADPHDQ